MSTYLAVNLLSALFPAAASIRGPWRADAREWRRILAALALAGGPFVLWDIAFTGAGVWGFNPRFLSGIGLFGLPLEEVLFFLCIPFACLFIYRAVRTSARLAFPARFLRPVWGGLASGCALTVFLADGRVYTQAVFALSAILLAWQAIRLPPWSGHFLTAAALHYIPFLLVNGYLTALPVFWYNPDTILGLRIGTIPVEDAAYSLSLLLLNVAAYEYLGARARGRQAATPAAGRRQALHPHRMPEKP